MKILKPYLFSLFLIPGIITGLTAQTKEIKQHEIPVKAAQTITLELEGNIIVHNWEFLKVSVAVETTTSGSIWGFSNLKKVRPYNVQIVEEGNKISVLPVHQKDLYMVGYITYQERYIHHVYLPKNIHLVILTKNGNVNVNGSFSSLNIQNKYGQVALFLPEKHIASLICKTKHNRIEVNGTTYEHQYQFNGSGHVVCAVNTVDARISIQLIK